MPIITLGGKSYLTNPAQIPETEPWQKPKISYPGWPPEGWEWTRIEPPSRYYPEGQWQWKPPKPITPPAITPIKPTAPAAPAAPAKPAAPAAAAPTITQQHLLAAGWQKVYTIKSSEDFPEGEYTWRPPSTYKTTEQPPAETPPGGTGTTAPAAAAWPDGQLMIDKVLAVALHYIGNAINEVLKFEEDGQTSHLETARAILDDRTMQIIQLFGKEAAVEDWAVGNDPGAVAADIIEGAQI